jgi:putative endonuclease
MAKNTSYYKGVAAENIVADYYNKLGYQTKAMRMKTTYGEIDLVMERAGQWAFVEVKCSKTTAQAATRISDHQALRIQAAAKAYLSDAELYGLVDCRFDAALVDASGRVEVIENVFI